MGRVTYVRSPGVSMAINLVAVARPTTTRKMAVLLIMTPATIEWNKIAIPQPFRLFSFRFAGISHGLDPKFHPSRHRNGAAACSSEIRGGIEIQLTNSELMLNSKGEQQVDYPTLFWHVHGANFAVIRSGLNRFRCQFFYTPHDQHGTGRKEYDSLEQCVTTLLQVQANHERNHDQS